jgi:two-component system sensor histidine kinase UhpB
MKELAAVANRFNMLAAALESAREENSHLYRRLITVQEEERREIASELHDEAGPCLFGITANAKSIQSMSEKIADPGAAQIHRRVTEVLSITERLRQLNRAMLKKLRPGSGQRAGISGLIEELVADFIRRHPGTEIVYTEGELANSYGESLDLTLYRSVQEGIVNAIRHGKAQHVGVDLGEELSEISRKGQRRSGKLSLTIRDDGRGIVPSTPRGFGLTAMNERVKAHGGSCVIKSERSKGTTISIDIPFGKAAKEPRAAELVGGMT